MADKLGTTPNQCSSATAKADGTLPCSKHETIIEFRPKPDWKGEFGFDWMRVYERENKAVVGFEYDNLEECGERPYIDGASGAEATYPITVGTEPLKGKGIVIGGYKSASEQMTPDEAKEKIRSEYTQMKIERGTSPLSYRLDTYFVPYLNLFPEKITAVGADGKPVDTLLGGTPPDLKRFDIPKLVPPKRPCEAELQILYDIKNEVPSKIAIEYDPALFLITGSGKSATNAKGMREYIIPSDKYKITPETYQQSLQLAETIKIKCLRELNDDYSIVVKAYSSTPRDEGTVVGMLTVCPNSAEYRKVVKMVFVKVKTNIKNDPLDNGKKGSFTIGVETLFRTLYQALITPDIINQDERGKDYELDLSKAPEFHIASDTKGFIRPNTDTNIPSKFILAHKEGKFFPTLVGAFKAQIASMDKDRFVIFAFDEYSQGAAGVTHHDSRRPPTIALFNNLRPNTLAHEQLHALGLPHTHIDKVNDKPVLPGPGCKYVFPEKTTKNIMSYSRERNSTWHWQWKIMRDNAETK